MKIKVLQRHIDAGVECDCHKCPITRAFEEAIPEAEHISIFDIYIYYINDVQYLDKLPMQVVKFINAFDNGEKVEPFEFEL